MKRLAITTLALALTAAAGSASAYQDGYGYGYGNRNGPRSDYATVLRVDPIAYDNGRSELRQECWNERTNGYEEGYYRDGSGRLYRRDSNNNSGGTILGLLIGGALGNQVGKGDGRKAATIGGAVIGGAIGNNIARNNDNYDQYRDDSGVVRRCRTVSDSIPAVTGYNVTYRYAGQIYHAMTRYNPGRTIRVVVDVRPSEGAIAYNR